MAFSLHSIFVAILAISSQSSAQSINIWNISGSVQGLDSNCITVLNQPVACDPYVLRIKSSRFETDSTLNTTCSPGCANSFSTYVRRIQGACGTQRYLDVNGWAYLPLYRVEIYYERFQQLCLKNTAGKFCNSIIRDALKINPDNQATSSGTAAPVTCGDCFISSMAQIVQQPLSSAAIYASILSSLQSSCKTTLSITTPARTTWSSPPTATTTSSPACQGTQYTIKSGDTCQSIALTQGLSTTKLLAYNNLLAYCRKFPSAGSSLCLPSISKCQPYAVKKGDTCQKIASANKASFAQIVSWNPEVGDMCSNMDHLINKTAVICISTPGGAWVNPSPVQSSTITTRKDPVFAATVSAMSNYGSVKPIAPIYPNGGYVTPYGNNTRLDCSTYAIAPVLVDAANRTFSYSCLAIAKAYGVSVADFLSWNPSITSNPCEVAGETQYCVQPIPRIAKDMSKNCTLTTVADPGWSCGTFATNHNITQNAVIAWNPSVGTNCTNYVSGTTYCIGVSHFRSSDTISNCAYWAMANVTSPSICNTMPAQYKITRDRFVAWNPSILSDCSGAIVGYDYCVGTPAIHPGFP